MANKKIKPLNVKSLYQVCELSHFDFKTTSELELLDQPLGQARAYEAINFAVDIEQRGFNLFVLGASGLGKHDMIEQVLMQRASNEGARSDWCYVNNFENPQKPRVLKLPTGMGHKLRQDMKTLVEDLLTSLPASFESEEYRSRRQEIEQEFRDRQDQAFKQLNDEAEEKGIIIMRTPGGYTLGPRVNNKPISKQEFDKLPDQEKHRLEQLIDEFQRKLQEIILDVPLIQRELHQRIKALNEEITQHAVEQLMAWMEKVYAGHPAVLSYLQAVKQNAITNVQAFLPSSRDGYPDDIASRVAEFHEYSINVVIDNAENDGSPIVYEDNPTYQNLTGRVEYISQFGTLMTDFTLIKSGALHRANGGYLIVDADKLLRHGFAWEGLKRALKSEEIKIQSLEQILSLANTVSLEPESIPLDVKVILVGESLLYYLLMEYDPEFSQLFKVVADFSRETQREPEQIRLYARLIAGILKKCEARPLNKAGVARVIEEASRVAGDAEKLSLHIDDMRDLLSEANYWAGKANRKTIALADVERAIEKRDYRRDRYRELIQEQVARGIKLIDCDGERVAQVNGLSVLEIGGYAFGQVSRITATARLGSRGIVDIERESKLGGEIHSKGVMILAAYLANHYAANEVLPLSATLTFEQSYGKIDGDSASVAELCALLSALGDIPLQQSLAVTGSTNQFGEVQAIGGVNEKVEGFFEVCANRGLTGKQGVIIPASNQVHLMLHKDVRDAVRKGHFHIYPATQIEDVMQLLTCLPPGKLNAKGEYPRQSFNHHIQHRIRNLQAMQKKFVTELERDARGKG